MAQKQTSKPVDPSKLSTVNQMILQLSNLLSDLLTASRATADATKLIQLNNEYMAIQSCMDQAIQTQAAANDILFKQVTSALKTQATMLQDMEKQINKIVSDVALVGRIVGYITQAIALVDKL
jgi:hypothetical protein